MFKSSYDFFDLSEEENESMTEQKSAEVIILSEQKHWQEHQEILTHHAMRKNHSLVEMKR